MCVNILSSQFLRIKGWQITEGPFLLTHLLSACSSTSSKHTNSFPKVSDTFVACKLKLLIKASEWLIAPWNVKHITLDISLNVLAEFFAKQFWLFLFQCEQLYMYMHVEKKAHPDDERMRWWRPRESPPRSGPELQMDQRGQANVGPRHWYQYPGAVNRM